MRTALTTDCWVLHLNGGYTLAISIYQVAELVSDTSRLPVPQAPAHCCSLISWRNKLIPLIDYKTDLPNSNSNSNNNNNNIMIVKFLGEEDNIHYLAFAVTDVEKYTVNDDDFSTLKNQNNLPFSSSIISAFHCGARGGIRDGDGGNNNINEQTTYIIDMKHLYSS